MRGIILRLKLLMSFAYGYDYPVEICVTCTVESRVSRGDERYLLNNTSSLFVFHIFNPAGIAPTAFIVRCIDRSERNDCSF